MKHNNDSSPLIPENYPDNDEDLALLALRSPGSPFFFFFFGCVRFGGFGLCFTISVKFLFFFFFLPLLVPVFGCSKNVKKEMGIWILVGVLKNLLKYGNV